MWIWVTRGVNLEGIVRNYMSRGRHSLSHSYLNPSSSVSKVLVLMMRWLRELWGDFWHYILHKFGGIGELEAEVLEEFGDHAIRAGDDSQAEVSGGGLAG